jgi:Lar family restriction alleviation protein
MKVLPCPFCGHNRISIHKIKMDLAEFVITRCEFCAASKSIPATTDEDADKKNVVIEWNKREY